MQRRGVWCGGEGRCAEGRCVEEGEWRGEVCRGEVCGVVEREGVQRGGV